MQYISVLTGSSIECLVKIKKYLNFFNSLPKTQTSKVFVIVLDTLAPSMTAGGADSVSLPLPCCHSNNNYLLMDTTVNVVKLEGIHLHSQMSLAQLCWHQLLLYGLLEQAMQAVCVCLSAKKQGISWHAYVTDDHYYDHITYEKTKKPKRVEVPPSGIQCHAICLHAKDLAFFAVLRLPSFSHSNIGLMSAAAVWSVVTTAAWTYKHATTVTLWQVAWHTPWLIVWSFILI